MFDEAVWGCAKILCSRAELEVTTYEGVLVCFLFICLDKATLEF